MKWVYLWHKIILECVIQEKVPQSPQVCFSTTKEAKAGKNKLPWSGGHKEEVAVTTAVKRPYSYC